MILYDRNREDFYVVESVRLSEPLGEFTEGMFRSQAPALAKEHGKDLVFTEGKVYLSGEVKSFVFAERTQEDAVAPEQEPEPVRKTQSTDKPRAKGKTTKTIMSFLRDSARVSNTGENVIDTIVRLERSGMSAKQIKACVDLSDDLIDDILEMYASKKAVK